VVRLRVLAITALATTLGGCVTLTPAQETGLQEARAFSKRVTDHYRMPPVYIMAGSLHGRAGATMTRDGVLRIEPTRLAMATGTDVVIAHELAHYVLGHRFTQGEDLAKTGPREMEANAEAVRVLAVARDYPEPVAFRLVLNALWEFKGLVDAGTRRIPFGHYTPCQEIADLVRRFQEYNGIGCQ
jgi:hypothetical protein